VVVKRSDIIKKGRARGEAWKRVGTIHHKVGKEREEEYILDLKIDANRFEPSAE
jgi:hypothetical protein